MIEAEHLPIIYFKKLSFSLFYSHENVTILLQFFLNLSTPNARIALENPKTCESIHADRIATVFPGCSSDIL